MFHYKDRMPLRESTNLTGDVEECTKLKAVLTVL